MKTYHFILLTHDSGNFKYLVEHICSCDKYKVDLISYRDVASLLDLLRLKGRKYFRNITGLILIEDSLSSLLDVGVLDQLQENFVDRLGKDIIYLTSNEELLPKRFVDALYIFAGKDNKYDLSHFLRVFSAYLRSKEESGIVKSPEVQKGSQGILAGNNNEVASSVGKTAGGDPNE